MWVEHLVSSNGADALWEMIPGGRLPDLVLLFGATDTLRQSAAAQRTAFQFPSALHLACSSGTTTDGRLLFDDGVRALAVGFDRTNLRMESMKLSGPASSRAVGETLGARLAAPDLAAVFVLSAGLNVNGSALVEGLTATIGDKVTLSGGLAGDGARFADTLVSVGGEASDDVVAAIGFYGDAIRVSHGSGGGWDEFGPTRKVTRSEGNVVYELDGKPALDLYERYLGPEAAGLPASGLLYPLSIWEGSGVADQVVRTILAIDSAARSLTFAGDVPQGWNARLMRGSFERLTQGAAEAAAHAKASDQLGGLDAQLCLFVSCVGRRLLMGQRAEEEIEAVARVLGSNTPFVGFYSYGEIAPHNASGACDLHNQTVTLTLLAEAA